MSTDSEDSYKNAHTTRCSGRYYNRVQVTNVRPRLEPLYWVICCKSCHRNYNVRFRPML